MRSTINSTGIIIVNTGSPAAPTSEAVAAYLRSFLSDPRICPMNPTIWHFILTRFIIPKRAPVSASKYETIWTDEGSPLDVFMASLARRLQDAYNQEAEDVFVCHAMSYASPSIEEALASCEARGCDEVIILPLYPQSAFSTTRAVREQADRALGRTPWEPMVRFVDGYGDEDLYIDAISDSIRNAGFGTEADDRLLFAFHSIPLIDIRKGDTYDKQTQRTARRVAGALELADDTWRIGYQCRFDKARTWLSPFTKAVLDEMADAGRLFVVAPNFSIDCLETLYDIQTELHGHWLEGRASRTDGAFRYVPCLNNSTVQVELIRRVVSKSKSA